MAEIWMWVEVRVPSRRVENHLLNCFFFFFFLQDTRGLKINKYYSYFFCFWNFNSALFVVGMYDCKLIACLARQDRTIGCPADLNWFHLEPSRQSQQQRALSHGEPQTSTTNTHTDCHHDNRYRNDWLGSQYLPIESVSVTPSHHSHFRSPIPFAFVRLAHKSQ